MILTVPIVPDAATKFDWHGTAHPLVAARRIRSDKMAWQTHLFLQRRRSQRKSVFFCAFSSITASRLSQQRQNACSAWWRHLLFSFLKMRFTPMQRPHISQVLNGDDWWGGRNPRRTLLTFSPGAWKDRMKSKLSSGMNNNELCLMSRLLLVLSWLAFVDLKSFWI